MESCKTQSLANCALLITSPEPIYCSPEPIYSSLESIFEKAIEGNTGDECHTGHQLHIHTSKIITRCNQYTSFNL